MDYTNLGLDKVSKDWEICPEDYRHLLRDAYQAGFEDGLAFADNSVTLELLSKTDEQAPSA
jgi:hypothetical protein